ncbi:MAG: hypothetical protein GXO71_06135 [Caldiserica bacterium]|nr:hypothetical protein [Caldisericota bacterium]
MIGFFPTPSVFIKAVSLVFSIAWIVWYLKRLPQDIRELKEKFYRFKNRFNPQVIEELKSPEKIRFYQEDASLQWWTALFVQSFLWLITLLLVLTLFFFLKGLILPVIQSWHYF